MAGVTRPGGPGVATGMLSLDDLRPTRTPARQTLS